MHKVIDRDELRDGRLTLWTAVQPDPELRRARLSVADGWGFVHWAEVTWMPVIVPLEAGAVTVWAERPPCLWWRSSGETVQLVADVQRITHYAAASGDLAIVEGREVFGAPSAGGEYRVTAEGEHR